MHKVLAALAAVAASIAVASVAAAQGVESETAPVSSHAIVALSQHVAAAPEILDVRTPERTAEVARWIDEFYEWKEWYAQWGNRRERGWFTSYRQRRPKPEPPAWLPDRCETVVDEGDPLLLACSMLAEFNDNDPNSPLRNATVKTVSQGEDTGKTTWWTHIHMDVLWPAMQVQSSVYGVIGIHTATTVKGRMEIFLAPGAMLLNLPSLNGNRTWKFATNYGFGYRLLDFTFPGNRQAVLHANFAKAWLMSDISDVVSGRTMDFVGFSITFKRP